MCIYIAHYTTQSDPMSSSASISAAKKRRANQIQPLQQHPPQMQRPISAPGANQVPSLASLTPAQRQQFMLQQQQRMQQMQQMQSNRNPQANPQQANPQQAANPKQLAWPAPPIYLMKQMDTLLFQQSQSIDDIKNRLNCIETGSSSGGVNDGAGIGAGIGVSAGITLDDIENIKPALMSDSEFVGGIVDNIMNNSNLSEIIEQIDAVQTENRELRELLHAQQKTINEMNIILLKLFSQSAAAAPVPVPAPAPAPAPVSAPVSVPVQDQVQEVHQEVHQEVQQEVQEVQDQNQYQDQNVSLEIVDK